MFQCKTVCNAECCGNVPLSKHILKKYRKNIQRKYEKIILDDEMIHPITTDCRCIFLNKECHCEIYKERPFVCKIYGTIKELQCPYINVNGETRTEEEIMQVREDIKKHVEERFFHYEMKYLKGQIMLPPFI